MLKKLARSIIRLRILIILIVIGLTVFFGYFARTVQLSSNLIDLAPEDNRELIALTKALEKFGSSTFVMISVKSDDVYSISTLTKIRDISRQIQKMPEVEEAIDPLNAKVFKYLFGMVVIKQSFPGGEIPESREKIEKLKEEMLSEPILKNVVVSENGESLAIYMKLKEGVDNQQIRNKLIAIVEPYMGPEEFYFAGGPIIESWVKDYISRDTVRLALPIVLLVIAVLYINFKSFRGIILPLTIMISSIIWTMGLMRIFGKTITMVGVMLPTLILVISSSYSIHFLNQYYMDIFTDSHKIRNIEKAFVQIGKTIILAALTTIAGFAALTINKIKPMMELGVFVLIGVFIAMTLSLTLLPGILCTLRTPKQRLYAMMQGSWINRIFSSLGGTITRSCKVILIISIGIGIWSIAGIRSIEVDTSWQRFFKKNSDILLSQKYIRSHFGGVSSLNISFEIDENQSNLDFRSLKTLRYVEQIEQWVRDRGLLGPTISLVGYVKRANQLINGNDPAKYRLPDTEADLLKILLMFKMSRFTKSLSNVITEDFRNANIVVRTSGVDKPVPTMPEFKQFIQDFRTYVKNHPFEGISPEISGVELIYVSLIDYLVRSQLLSIAISVIIVFFIITYTFRSFVYGAFGLIPIIFGLLLNFGAMSYFKIPLDFVTSMIASIAVGLGVDNSIHYLIRFARTRHNLPLDERIKVALTASGIPIFFTSFTLIAGFSVLLFSSFKPILYFGLLISVTMFGCLIGVIFILPALIYFTRPKAILKGRID